MEFEGVLRSDRKKTTILIAYFKAHSNGRPLVACNEIACSYATFPK